MYRCFCGASFLVLVTGIAAAFAAGVSGWAGWDRRRPDLGPWGALSDSPLFNPELFPAAGRRQRRDALRGWAAALVLGALAGVVAAHLAGPPDTRACWVTSPTHAGR